MGKKIKTTPKLFELIVCFVENEGAIVYRDDIINAVYGIDAETSDSNINTLIKEFRRATSKDIIKTVRGVGYMYSCGE